MQLFEFEKVDVPSDLDQASNLADTLMKFGVSLLQYQAAVEAPEVTM